MKHIIYLFLILLIFAGCSINPKVKDLPKWEDEKYTDVLVLFENNCKKSKAKEIYGSLCEDIPHAENAKEFFENNFELKEVGGGEVGLLTGYYEPQLRGSLVKKAPYLYPIYKRPKDLIVVELDKIYPELKRYRLRGRVVDGKLVPYYSRQESKNIKLNADVICYVDSKIDRFFLEVQGSGRISLDNGKEIFVGFSNQNGHRYSSIGKYLINKGEIAREDISLQSIREWLLKHPNRIDEVLNYNKSMVYFEQRGSGATGSLGVALTPKRSVAVDRRYIKLGSLLYMDAVVDSKNFERFVFAQDTGGAIKGKVRADLFLGYGDEAMRVAGELKSPLKLWVLLPKKRVDE